MKTDYVVFIGRFQPFHTGHLNAVKSALKRYQHIIIVCGSLDKPRDIRNPWTFEERKDMIYNSIPNALRDNVSIIAVHDTMYNDNVWVSDVSEAVEHVIFEDSTKVESLADCRAMIKSKQINVSILGHIKDHTSYYLKIFPYWSHIDINDYEIIDATDIRVRYFNGHVMFNIGGPSGITKYVAEYLSTFAESNEFKYIQREFKFVEFHKQSWSCDATIKYGGPILNTVDAIITCMGHILLVKRRAHPGKNLWAFPGGYILDTEKIEDAMIRELREETKIKIPVPVLKGSIVGSHVFDDPERSVRGRIITHAYHIELNQIEKLPKIKGSDDALKAKWVPISDFNLMHTQLFEDHFYIGQYFLRNSGR